MTSFRNRMLVIAAVALAAISTSAPRAAAQAAAAGSFTLSHEVRWQASTLPAGDYTFTMDSAASPVRIKLHGPNGYEFVLAMVADNSVSGESSSLTIERRDGSPFVRELYLAPIGLRLKYHVPKASKESELARGPVTTEQILVAMK